MRVIRFQPQMWIRDNAVDAEPSFTFEVTTALAALARTDPALVARLEDEGRWDQALENCYDDAITTGQIPQRWDGPSDMHLVPGDVDRADHPEPARPGVIAKTTITFTVAHRADCDLPTWDLATILRETDSGDAVGQVTAQETVRVPDAAVPALLRSLGNDGEFFDDALDLPDPAGGDDL